MSPPECSTVKSRRRSAPQDSAYRLRLPNTPRNNQPKATKDIAKRRNSAGKNVDA